MSPASESGQSASSFGSGVSGVENIETTEEQNEMQAPFINGVFGVLYTVSKEKSPPRPFVAFRLFLDWLQLFLLIVSGKAQRHHCSPDHLAQHGPARHSCQENGMAQPSAALVWQAFSFISLNYFMSARGYTFFLACMYSMAFCLWANLALCIWVSRSFQQNKFDHVWPIAWLRVFSLVFFQVLDIASLSLFLIALDCQYFATPVELLGMNQEFGNVYCWSMPHIIHATVAAVSVALFVLLATIFTAAEVELNPVSKNLLGMAHSKVEVMGFGIRMVMTACSVFINGQTWVSVVYLIASFLLAYLYLVCQAAVPCARAWRMQWLPHLHATINHIRVATYSSVLYAALLFIILAYAPGVDQNNPKEVSDFRNIMTTLLWAGFVPAGLAGAIASYLHTHYWAVTVVGKFREAGPEVKLKKIHPFTDPRQVEIASRCCRQWLDEDTLEPDAVVLAERIISAGKLLMPHRVYMVIWYSSFLIDVQGSYQTGYAELMVGQETAVSLLPNSLVAKKGSNPSLLERFCIFIRDQEHTQKSSAATSGDNGSVDLVGGSGLSRGQDQCRGQVKVTARVSYVEFQRGCRLAIHMHEDALLARRTFWETLLHANVTFDKLTRAVARIEVTVRAAERMYKQASGVLSRHSSSVKVLQLYVKFLQGVRNDPWSAARWAAEAEKLQKMEEEANERAVFGGNASGGGMNSDDTKGVIIMGANCLIRMINDGKNINVIVPPPFSRNHNNYVRSYLQTGKAKILDSTRAFVAVHKDRFVLPISVSVIMLLEPGLPPLLLLLLLLLVISTVLLAVLLQVFVTKVSGVGEDSVFMGVFSAVPMERNVATLWVLGNGSVLSCDSAFTNWLGYRHDDIHGKAVSSLAVQTEALEELLVQVKKESAIAMNTKAIAGDGMLLQQTVWQMHDLHMRHLYQEDLAHVDIMVKIGGINETALFELALRRHDESSKKLLVSDSRGRIVHVTHALAAELGSTVSKLQAGGSSHAMDSLLASPFMRIHRQASHQRWEEAEPVLQTCLWLVCGLAIHQSWYSEKADEPPHWSCRSGMSVYLPAMTSQGLVQRPYSINFSNKVLDERRLLLVLSSKGIVQEVSASPASLFNFEPTALLGSHLSYVIDVLRPRPGDGGADIASMMEDELQASKLLMHMAERSYATPGMSWRVGVSPIMDPVQLAALGPIGMAIIAKQTIPASMTVECYMQPPVVDGATVMLPPELQIRVEVWRADVLSGVVELDTHGNVAQLGVKDQPVYSPHLLMGLPPTLMLGAHISSLISLSGRPHLEALFTEGALGRMPGKLGAPPRQGRGGIAKGAFNRRKTTGPLHYIKVLAIRHSGMHVAGCCAALSEHKGRLRSAGVCCQVAVLGSVQMVHGTDCAELELELQAVVKQDAGSSCSLYLLIHASQPKCGREDFRTWLWGSPTPSLSHLATNKSARRRSTAAYDATGPVDIAPHSHLPAGLRQRLLAAGGGGDVSGSDNSVRAPPPRVASFLNSGMPQSLPVAGVKSAPSGRYVPDGQPGSGRGPPASMSMAATLMQQQHRQQAAVGRGSMDAPSTACLSAVDPEVAGTGSSTSLQDQGQNSSGSASGSQSSKSGPAVASHLLAFKSMDSSDLNTSMKPLAAINESQVLELKGSKGPLHVRSGLAPEGQQLPVEELDESDMPPGMHYGLVAPPFKQPSRKFRSPSKEVLPLPAPPASDGDSEQEGPGGPDARMNSWMVSQSKMGAAKHSDHASSVTSEEESEGSSDGGGEGNHNGAAQEDAEEGSEAVDVDEAGSTVNDFKRGKRLKRLIKTLAGPQAMLTVTRLKVTALVIAAMLVGVDLAMFVTFLQLAKSQSDQVLDLQSVGFAIHHVLQVAISVSSLGTLFAGAGLLDIRYLGKGGTEDRTYQIDFMEAQIAKLDELHRGVYRGFNTPRRLTPAFDIRSIWEEPVNTFYGFFQSGPDILLQSELTGLWDGGNTYIKQARDILQNSVTLYGQNDTIGGAFNRDPNRLSMVWNGPKVLVPAYMKTLDGLMQKAIGDSKTVNNVQLIVLAVEGGVVSVIAIAVMWFATSRAVYRRYAVYTVFMLMPQGLVKALATKSVELGEGNAEDMDETAAEGDDAATGDGSGFPGNNRDDEEDALRGPSDGGRGGGGGAIVGAKLNMTALQALAAAKANRPSFGKRVVRALMFWKPADATDAQGNTISAAAASLTKRRLHQSSKAVLWLVWVVWPFIFWALFVVVINSLGFVQLASVTSPIATSNIAQFVKFRAKSVMFLSQRLVSSYFLNMDVDGIVVVPTYPVNGTRPIDKEAYRSILRLELEALKKEYSAMLYGRESPLVAGDNTPHFQLATQGVMFSQGADILYNLKYVDNGLDQAMKQLLYAAESLLVQEDDALDLDNEAFRFIFTCGNSDVTGGLTLLNDRYNSYVQGVYQQAVVLHIITFVVCCLVCVAFLLLILQPYTTGMVAESRRIAELLSHLPPEMDVEALVTGKLITSQTSASIYHTAHTLACMRDTSALIAKAGTDDPQIAIAAAVTAKEEAAAAAREAREANKSGKGRRASLDGPPAPMALTRHGSVLAVAPA
ncbi:hypothetical protein QJQ45_022220 [Haematococcus lacustris]|nr:hypothetical protein QJQ45_022220 [Haematococcus lacustris]